MKKFNLIPLIFAALGTCLLVGSLCFCLSSLNKPATMVETPQGALDCSEKLMEALKAGDYTAASGYLYGQVDLGVDREPEEEIGKLLWEAFLENMNYKFIGDCYPTTTGIARTVRITTLDPNTTNHDLGQKVDAKLESLLAAEGDISEIYDGTGNFRDDLLRQLLVEAFEKNLKNEATTVTRDIKLNLVYQDGSWWVVPDAALLQAISGGVAG